MNASRFFLSCFFISALCYGWGLALGESAAEAQSVPGNSLIVPSDNSTEGNVNCPGWRTDAGVTVAPLRIPCPKNTKAIHVRNYANDGGLNADVAFGGSAVTPETSPVIRGPTNPFGSEYTNQGALWCVSTTVTRVQKVNYSCKR